MKKIFAFLTAAMLAFGTLTLSACTATETALPTEPITMTDLKLDTVVTITIYDSADQDLLTESMKLCDKYEKIFSRTREDSELYQLNHRQLPTVSGSTDTYELSEPLAELLSIALSCSSATDNAFDPAIAPLTSLWDFKSANPKIPDSEDIRKAVEASTSEGVILKDREITLSSPDTAFDLGAVAKGYIADRIKDYLISQDVHSAIISLGGNILCIGEKAADTPFKIGIQKPFADRNETIAIVDINDKSVVSSGIYERYFEKYGTLYHHILNPETGYPYENDLISVTIISDRSVDGDALSTSCFALGLEKGMEYLESLDGMQGVFITDDYEVHYTKGFQDELKVTENTAGQ